MAGMTYSLRSHPRQRSFNTNEIIKELESDLVTGWNKLSPNAKKAIPMTKARAKERYEHFTYKGEFLASQRYHRFIKKALEQINEEVSSAVESMHIFSTPYDNAIAYVTQAVSAYVYFSMDEKGYFNRLQQDAKEAEDDGDEDLQEIIQKAGKEALSMMQDGIRTDNALNDYAFSSMDMFSNTGTDEVLGKGSDSNDLTGDSEKFLSKCKMLCDVKEQHIIVQIMLVELENAAYRWLTKESIHQGKTETNFMTLLPMETMDAFDILDDAANSVVIDIERIATNVMMHDLHNDKGITPVMEKMLNRLKKKDALLVKAQNALNDAYSDMNAKDQIIKSLTEKKNAIAITAEETAKNKCEEKYRKELDEKDSEIRRLRKIEKEYNELKANAVTSPEKTVSDKVTNEETSLQSSGETDAQQVSDGKYCFVGSTRFTGTKKAIEKAFPNSRFTEKTDDVSADNTDCVVVLTNMIEHSTYYYYRSLCSKKGIPLIHCKVANVERIKELIANVIGA